MKIVGWSAAFFQLFLLLNCVKKNTVNTESSAQGNYYSVAKKLKSDYTLCFDSNLSSQSANLKNLIVKKLDEEYNKKNSN